MSDGEGGWDKFVPVEVSSRPTSSTACWISTSMSVDTCVCSRNLSHSSVLVTYEIINRQSPAALRMYERSRLHSTLVLLWSIYCSFNCASAKTNMRSTRSDTSMLTVAIQSEAKITKAWAVVSFFLTSIQQTEVRCCGFVENQGFQTSVAGQMILIVNQNFGTVSHHLVRQRNDQSRFAIILVAGQRLFVVRCFGIGCCLSTTMDGITAQGLDERFADSIEQSRFDLPPPDISGLAERVHPSCHEQQPVGQRRNSVESSAFEIEPMSWCPHKQRSLTRLLYRMWTRSKRLSSTSIPPWSILHRHEMNPNCSIHCRPTGNSVRWYCHRWTALTSCTRQHNDIRETSPDRAYSSNAGGEYESCRTLSSVSHDPNSRPDYAPFCTGGWQQVTYRDCRHDLFDTDWSNRIIWRCHRRDL